MIELASEAQVEAALGRPLADSERARSGAAVAAVSAKMDAASGFAFTHATRTGLVKVGRGRVRPLFGHVTRIIAVADEDGAPVEFVDHGSYATVAVADDGALLRVTFESGWLTVPDEVQLQVAAAAARVLATADSGVTAGVTSRSVTNGPFAEHVGFASWATSGQIALSPDDLAVARWYGPRRGGRCWVAEP